MAEWFKKTGKISASAARRITGISSPFGGIQWSDPGPSDVETVRQFLIFLEDRRVLYNSMILEIGDQVNQSIQEIRDQSTKALQELQPDAFAVQPIRSIRSACRRFYDDRTEVFRFFDDGHLEHGENLGFFAALGSFRSTVGTQVALLAAYYDIDVEGDLAAILPSLDDEQ